MLMFSTEHRTADMTFDTVGPFTQLQCHCGNGSQSTWSVTQTPPSHALTKRMRRKLLKLFRKLCYDRIRLFVSGNVEVFSSCVGVESSMHKSSSSFVTRSGKAAKVYFTLQRKQEKKTAKQTPSTRVHGRA